MTTPQVTHLLSLLTVAGQVFTIVILLSVLLKIKSRLLGFLWRNALKTCFVVALTATLGSLYFSEVAGFEPCKLCWYQRILMYPQVLLYGLALWKKEKHIVPYGLLLSAVGAVIAGYHYLLQIGVVPSLVCDAVGYSVSCSQRFVMTFGYITIPMMALSAFLVIIALLMTIRKK